jgi:iron complex outermembrane receptor protein
MLINIFTPMVSKFFNFQHRYAFIRRFCERGLLTVILTIVIVLMQTKVFAQTDTSEISPVLKLKKMSIEELMNVEVTSVSKRPEKLIEAASAIQVITQEDIRSSGATNVPEALRLAPNLEVAQVNSSQWAISARGFNNVLANKLLVMIDGRVVYTPMYAGVFWDVQTLMLEDVDRIEVISGPGGTLWGANAVNGVINIITKKSKDTQGALVTAAAGANQLESLGSLRYGGKLAENISYRVYGTAFKRDNTRFLKDSLSSRDSWTMGQGGFRLDWEATKRDAVALISNFYDGRPNPDGGNAKPVITMGGNMLGRWNHTISEKSDFQLQAYFDQTWRDFRNRFAENLRTYDLDWQHRFQVGKRNEVVWGSDIRLMDHKVDTLKLFAFVPPRKLLHIYSVFVQDKITLIKERLSLTIGSKFEHNSYTGMQYQPSGRLAWTPGKRQTIWAAVSRAVRTPSRIDREFVLSLAPGLPYIEGSSNFKSETLLAYELGWRIQPIQRLSISLSTYYNFYDNLRTAQAGPAPLGIPITFGNGVKGETYGAELSVTHQLTKWWNLRGGYTFLKKNLWVKANNTDLNGATAESDDPQNQFLIQSNIKFPYRFELGTVIRYVDKLPKPAVRGYTGLDVRVGWKLNKVIELNVVGQNLIGDNHVEFIPSSPAPRIIQRSVYGKITCRF